MTGPAANSVLEDDPDLAADYRSAVDVVAAVRPEHILEVGRDIEPGRQLKAVVRLDDGLGALILQSIAELAVVTASRRPAASPLPDLKN